MEDLRIGAWVRSERRRLGMRQADLAQRAGVSRTTVSRVENGLFSELTITAARAVADAVGIMLPFAPRSLRGASIERQIDWRHAALIETVLGRLTRLGWHTAVEYSFNDFGDRGSVDVLAWEPDARALLIVEVKSDLRNVQETLHALDIKRRVVPRLLQRDRGWRADAVGLVMVLADLRVERQRIDRHRSTFDAALPSRTVEVRRWLERPVGPLRGVWFLQIVRPTGAKQQPAGHGRVRRAGGGAGASSERGGRLGGLPPPAREADLGAPVAGVAGPGYDPGGSRRPGSE